MQITVGDPEPMGIADDEDQTAFPQLTDEEAAVLAVLAEQRFRKLKRNEVSDLAKTPAPGNPKSVSMILNDLDQYGYANAPKRGPAGITEKGLEYMRRRAESRLTTDE